MSVQRIVEDTPPIEMQAETQYDDTEPQVRDSLTTFLLECIHVFPLTIMCRSLTLCVCV